MNTTSIQLHINGEQIADSVEDRISLADYLRHQRHLTGTHLGCEHGVCGACTVLVDGRSARSCLMLAAQADGRQVCTVESLARDGELHPLQEAFWNRHGLQCGFCTPGILMTLEELLREDPAPDEAAIRTALSGNLCRCTGYQNIVAAALEAAAHMRTPGAATL
ncbi:(2Fe-2S)-binding protein [Oxalobacteraceae bacterium CAVE-383]|nr:(2Fe-2S)-binding protein [Oxalobacteraceae bacterium CAVE-383]